MIPLKKKVTTKQSEYAKAKSHAEAEEEKVSKLFASFSSDVKDLRDVESDISKYEASSAIEELESMHNKRAELDKAIAIKQKEAKSLEVELDEKKNAVNDHERHKKQLMQNIDIIQGDEVIQDLVEEINQLQSELDQIEGASTVDDKWQKANAKKKKQQEESHRMEGRSGEVRQQIQSLKVGVVVV